MCGASSSWFSHQVSCQNYWGSNTKTWKTHTSVFPYTTRRWPDTTQIFLTRTSVCTVKLSQHRLYVTEMRDADMSVADWQNIQTFKRKAFTKLISFIITLRTKTPLQWLYHHHQFLESVSPSRQKSYNMVWKV